MIFALFTENDQSPDVLRRKRSYDTQKESKERTRSDNAVRTSSPEAVFATENSTVVVAQIGGTTTLPCVVKKFSGGVVSFCPGR